MGLTARPEHRTVAYEPQSQEGWVTTKLDFLVNWGRANSLWPMPYGTACCAIEFMATAAARFDLARAEGADAPARYHVGPHHALIERPGRVV